MIRKNVNKYGKDHEVMYTQDAREMRAMLPEEYRHMLLTQTGSAVAICTSNVADTLGCFCFKLLERSKNFHGGPGTYDPRVFYRANDFRILIQHRTDNGLYSLIGGARQPCESFPETALREVKEETELKAEDMLPLGTISGGDSMINIYPDGNAAEGIDALYLAMVPIGTVARPDSETREFIWMTPDEIKAAVAENLWHPAQVKTVELLLSKLLQLPEVYMLHTTAKPW